MADWKIASCVQVERKPTKEEQDKKRAELWAKADMVKWMERIQAMPEGEDKEKYLVGYKNNEETIRQFVEEGMILEWQTVYRDPTPEERAQRKADLHEAQETQKRADKERKERLAIMRRAAKAMKLSTEDYLKAFPSDVSVEELNAE